MPGLENQNIASGISSYLSVKNKYSSTGVVDLHFGVTFYRREHNTGKRKITINTLHVCNAQYVCMIKLLHRKEALDMLDKFLGFDGNLCNYGENYPGMDPGGRFGQF